MTKLLNQLKNSYPRCGPKSEMIKINKFRLKYMCKRKRIKPSRYIPLDFRKKLK